jgi:hypothetical protein
LFRSYKSRRSASPYAASNSQDSYPGCFVPTGVGTLYFHMLPATVRTRTLVVSFLQEQAHCISICYQQQSRLVPWLFRSYKSRHIVSPYAASNSQNSYPGCFVSTRVGALYLHMLPPTVRSRIPGYSVPLLFLYNSHTVLNY